MSRDDVGPENAMAETEERNGDSGHQSIPQHTEVRCDVPVRKEHASADRPDKMQKVNTGETNGPTLESMLAAYASQPSPILEPAFVATLLQGGQSLERSKTGKRRRPEGATPANHPMAGKSTIDAASYQFSPPSAAISPSRSKPLETMRETDDRGSGQTAGVSPKANLRMVPAQLAEPKEKLTAKRRADRRKTATQEKTRPKIRPEQKE